MPDCCIEGSPASLIKEGFGSIRKEWTPAQFAQSITRCREVSVFDRPKSSYLNCCPQGRPRPSLYALALTSFPSVRTVSPKKPNFAEYPCQVFWAIQGKTDFKHPWIGWPIFKASVSVKYWEGHWKVVVSQIAKYPHPGPLFQLPVMFFVNFFWVFPIQPRHGKFPRRDSRKFSKF